MNIEINNRRNKELAIRYLVSELQCGKSYAKKKLLSLCRDLIGKVSNRYEIKELSCEDIIAACESGLILAACKFDLTTDFTFESYAVWWLKQEILQAQKRIVSSK